MDRVVLTLPCYCPPIRKSGRRIDNQIAIAKIEVDEEDNMKIAGHYKVRGFPTLILFQHGEERGRFSGAKPLSFIRTFLEEHAEL